MPSTAEIKPAVIPDELVPKRRGTLAFVSNVERHGGALESAREQKDAERKDRERNDSAEPLRSHAQ